MVGKLFLEGPCALFMVQGGQAAQGLIAPPRAVATVPKFSETAAHDRPHEGQPSGSAQNRSRNLRVVGKWGSCVIE